MPVKINGTTSGSVTLAAPATGSDVTLTLPGSAGTVALTTGAGLQFITSQDFSAVSSVNINNCFTSTYDNYLLHLRGTKSEGTAAVDFRLRVSGSDDSGSNYVRRYITSGGAGTSVTAGENTITTGVICIPGASSPFAIGADAVILGPNLVSQTLVRSLSFPSYMVFDATRHTQSTAYDGITLLTSTGTMTGTVRIYGYRNS